MPDMIDENGRFYSAVANQILNHDRHFKSGLERVHSLEILQDIGQTEEIKTLISNVYRIGFNEGYTTGMENALLCRLEPENDPEPDDAPEHPDPEEE